MSYPIKIEVDRTANVEGFPLISGNLPYSKVISGEFADKDPLNIKPEAHIIDTENVWLSILDRIKLELDKSSIPPIDFNKNAVLAYFFGTTGTGGNKYKIKKVEGVLNTLNIYFNIEFVKGSLDVVTSPYLIISIPKTSHKKVIFEIIEGSKESTELYQFENS